MLHDLSPLRGVDGAVLQVYLGSWVRCTAIEDRVDQYDAKFFHEIGRACQGVRLAKHLPDKTEQKMGLMHAYITLEALRTQADFPLRKGFAVALDKLQAEVNDAYVDIHTGGNAEYVPLENALDHFESVLSSEYKGLNLFLVKPIRAYDMGRLVAEGERIIDQRLHGLLSPLAFDDVRSATRCFSFGLPTACVFHSVRAVEEVMRRYYREFVGPLPSASKSQTMGAMYGVFTRKNLDPLILAELGRIKDEYRNPVTHPDKTYSQAEAETFLPNCVHAIEGMLSAISANKMPADTSLNS